MKRYVRKFSISAFAAFGALTITLLAYFFTSKTIQEREELEFKNISFQVNQSISSRMKTYINALVQTRSMFYVTTEVDRSEFHNYVNNLNLLKLYPGIQGIGFTQRILKKDLKSHVAAIRREGFPDYKVWPDFERPEYHSIVYLEPFDWRNKKAFGFDMFTDPTRRVAMEGARDSGKPFSTNRVILVQETERDIQYGFLIYVPYYDSVDVDATIESRREKLKGFVYSPFRSKDLFRDILEPIRNERVGVEIFIGDDASENLIFASKNLQGIKSPEQVLKNDLEVAEKKWLIKTYALPGFSKESDYTAPLLLLIIGLLFSLSLFWIVWKYQKFTRLERERAKNFEALHRIGKTLSAELNLEKLVQAITDVGVELSQADYGAFFYHAVDEKGVDCIRFTLSGLFRETTENQELPFDKMYSSIFHKKTTYRCDDITHEPDLIQKLPFLNLVRGHPPVRSFMAVFVISRTGKVLGVLFFYHSKVGIFKDREQMLVEGIASQAAIAIDNAKLHQEMTDAVAARDEFLSIASHELKTPITSMKLQFQLAQKLIMNDDEKVYDREAVKKRVLLAASQLERMSKLVNDMLETTRFSSRRLDLIQDVLDLNDVTQLVIDSLQQQLDSKNIKLTFMKNAQDPLVYGDKNRLEQVLNNLITNAMKYGNGKPIEVITEEKDNSLLLMVRDHGMGIPADKIDSIFNRFERVDSNSPIRGLGLGLYISKEIIEAHKGKIWVESVLDQGSTFYVQLPRF